MNIAKRRVVRIDDPAEFVHAIVAGATAPRPLSPREDCPICRAIPPMVTIDDPWPPDADRLRDVVTGVLKECPTCRRLYAYSYWFKMGEAPEATLREVDASESEPSLVAAASASPWALQQDDGTWVLRYDPAPEEILPLLSPEERDEVADDLESTPFGLRGVEAKLRRFQADRAFMAPWLEQLEDEQVWLRLEPGGEWLWRSGRLGIETVRMKGRRVDAIHFWLDFQVCAGLRESVRTRPGLAVERVDKKVLERLRSIDTAAAAALARLEAGQAWPVELGEIMAAGGSFFAVREKEREATPVSGLRLREWLTGAARTRRSLASSALEPDRRRRLEALLDPARQVDLIREGRLTLYGSAGSVLDFREGHFGWLMESGRLALTEARVQAILGRKSYSWMKWT